MWRRVLLATAMLFSLLLAGCDKRTEVTATNNFDQAVTFEVNGDVGTLAPGETAPIFSSMNYDAVDEITASTAAGETYTLQLNSRHGEFSVIASGPPLRLSLSPDD